MDWVFTDGPPKSAKLYDNNHRQDFHAIVPKCIPEELYWVEEEKQICRKLQEDRRLKEEAMRAKVSLTLNHGQCNGTVIMSCELKIEGANYLCSNFLRSFFLMCILRSILCVSLSLLRMPKELIRWTTSDTMENQNLPHSE